METKYIVNNLAEQTIDGDVIINGNFTVTGTTNTRPYKVYTALLTQSGSSDTINFGDDSQQPFVIGATYMIAQNDDNGDFTNIGAPNNNVGTYFVATGTTPSSWGDNIGSGGVNVTYNAGAPVVTVLENTIGNVWFTYNSVGAYICNSNNLFEFNKTYVYIGDSSSGVANGVLSGINKNNNDNIQITTVLFDTSGSDNELNLTPIEIRVYN